MFVVNLKALIVVLAFALFVFAVVKPLCLRFMAPEVFVFRRNLWLGLTAVGFLSPNVWVHLAITSATLVWAGRKDPNPAALYLLLLHVVPPYPVSMLGSPISSLYILMTHYRLLALMLLLPVALRLYRNPQPSPARQRLQVLDAMVLGYGLLQIIQLIPYEPINGTMRRLLIFGSDVWLPYYVMSRYFRDAKSLTEAFALFCLACAIHVPISVFEALHHWILYAGIGQAWATRWVSGSSWRSAWASGCTCARASIRRKRRSWA
jgi:hypothetical protein